ncbi:MAG: RidA family protein [Lentisphaerae bacterium]|nr:RidA family protein [Lentisphaerota bacterium]
MKQVVSTPQAPAAIGPYSQAIAADNLLFISGQLGLDPATGAFAGPGVKEQTEQVLKNIKAVVEAAGLSMADIVACTVYIADMNEFPQVNDIYGRYFTEKPPARATVEVSRLPKNGRVEISAIALR